MGLANSVVLGAVPDAQNDGINIAAFTVTVAGAGVGTIVAPVAGKRIFVHGMIMSLSAATTVTFQDVSGSATVALTGAMTLATGIPLDLEWQNYPWFSCAAGDALQISLGAAATAAGRIMYMQG